MRVDTKNSKPKFTGKYRRFLYTFLFDAYNGLTNPHGHHIVFKGNFKGLRGIYVNKSQAILKAFNIDINDLANLMWASNTKGVHTTINAKEIFVRLSEMQKELDVKVKQGLITPKQAQQEMKKELQSAGKDFFSCY